MPDPALQSLPAKQEPVDISSTARRRPPVLARSPARCFRTSAPFPPSPPLRDEHMVVHGYNAPCVCTPCWAYAVRAGIEPADAARIQIGIAPPEGCAHFSLRQLPTRPSPQLVQQRRQPIRFLDPRVEFPILLGKIIRLPLDRGNAHCLMNFTSERVVRPCVVDAAVASSRYAL
jgi:hypothetical protein